jgi:tRNA threonylcarbamoyladenosine biosynthesis protein TsaE
MAGMEQVVIKNEAELRPLARTVLQEATEHTEGMATVITLAGDLGAGKTAFTKALAAELGITEHITSPTFVIMKSYPVVGHGHVATLTHIDAYRIDDEAEVRVLNIPALFADPKQLIVIEWPERIPGIIPVTAYPLSFTITEDTHRTVTYGH